MTAPGPLPREFFGQPADQVAPGLLGCVITHQTGEGLVAVRLSEVEAYLGEADPASHAYRGRTRRNAVMFGPPGHAYVYFTYGMHFCLNLVCGPGGTASAVLLRAGRVIEGAALAGARRGRKARARGDRGDDPAPPAAAVAERDLARGPARLCEALGIDRSHDGADACDPGSPVQVLSGSAPAGAAAISAGPRVGVSRGADLAWRFWITGDPAVSVYRAHVPRRARVKPVARVPGEGGTMPG